MPFCNRCNTNLENYMKFCWNCGAPVPPQQAFGGGPPVNHHAHHQGTYQESYSVNMGGGPYDQQVTVTYGGGPPHGRGHPHAVHHRHMQSQKVVLTCAFCEGEGTHPMNFDQPCPVCRGAGRNSFFEPYTQCQQCEGSGKRFATMDEICPTCHGKGYIQI
jgi:DnaJ-class molecular chaperone